MTDNEINMFIDAMDDLGDKWDYEDVKRVYGDDSLQDAINDRTTSLNMHYHNLATLIR